MKIFCITFIFICLSQITTAQMITVQGQIINIDKNSINDISVFLIDYKNEKAKINVNLDSLGQFEIEVETWQHYRLEVVSFDYLFYKKNLYFKRRNPKLITLELKKREKSDNGLIKSISSADKMVKIGSKIDTSNLSIKGVLLDRKGEPLMFANVAITQNGQFITGTQTDFDGNFVITNLPKGHYQLECSYVGFYTKKINKIEIKENQSLEITAIMFQGIEIEQVYTNCGPQIINASDLTRETIFSAKELQRSPHKN